MSQFSTAIDLNKTSGTSPPVYHFTSSMHLPRILQSGELQPLLVMPENIRRWPELPRVDFIHATTNSERDPTGRKVKMHRRRGHVRTLHRGLPNEFTVYINPVWINAIAGVVPPPVVYTLETV